MSRHFQKKRADDTGDRLPPHAPEAERGVLGCLSMAPLECMNTCEEAGVTAEWFYELPHQVIFNAMRELHRSGVLADVIALQQWLRDAGQLDQVGGITYLSQLQDAVPSGANLPHYLELAREKWQLRRLVAACAGTVAAVYENEALVDEHIAAAEKQILSLSETNVGQPERWVKEILPEVVDQLEKYSRGHAQLRGLATGFSYLDKMFGGLGGDDNNMTVLAGRPGTGKTSLALDIALHVGLKHPRFDRVTAEEASALDAAGQKVLQAKDSEQWFAVRQGLPVAIFSLEMTAKALVQRMAFQLSGADTQRWRTGFAQAEDFVVLTKAIGEISKSQICIDDSGRMTIDELKARARRLKRQHNIKLFVVDYIQLLSSANRRFRDDRVQELAEISGELQKLGKELRTPFIILAQMNRDLEKDPNREPRLSDLKDCGAIEQDADIVAFLYTPKKAHDDEKYLAAMAQKFGENDWAKRPKRVDVLVAKARNGPTGPVQMLFMKSSTHFVDYFDWLKTNNFQAPAAGESKLNFTDEELGMNR